MNPFKCTKLTVFPFLRKIDSLDLVLNFQIDQHRKNIAVSSNSKEYFEIVDDVDFNHDKHLKFFERPVMKVARVPSCLMSAFLQQTKLTAKLCSITIAETLNKEIIGVQHLGDGNWLLSGEIGEKLKFTCPSKHHRLKELNSGVHHLVMTRGCSAYTEKYRINQPDYLPDSTRGNMLKDLISSFEKTNLWDTSASTSVLSKHELQQLVQLYPEIFRNIIEIREVKSQLDVYKLAHWSDLLTYHSSTSLPIIVSVMFSILLVIFCVGNICASGKITIVDNYKLSDLSIDERKSGSRSTSSERGASDRQSFGSSSYSSEPGALDKRTFNSIYSSGTEHGLSSSNSTTRH